MVKVVDAKGKVRSVTQAVADYIVSKGGKILDTKEKIQNNDKDENQTGRSARANKVSGAGGSRKPRTSKRKVSK